MYLKSVMHVQSCCFDHKLIVFFCGRRRGCLSSLFLAVFLCLVHFARRTKRKKSLLVVYAFKTKKTGAKLLEWPKLKVCQPGKHFSHLVKCLLLHPYL